MSINQFFDTLLDLLVGQIGPVGNFIN